MEGLAVPFNAIKEGLSNIFNGIGTILSYLNPFSDNFILKSVINFLNEMLQYINPFNEEKFFGYKIIELFSNLLKSLFVPETNPFTDLSSKFNEKFIFVSQIKDLINSLLGNVDYGNSTPSFNFTWYGTTISIIDFSLFLEYRVWLHGIILAIAWYMFLHKLFKKLPGIIGGFSQ